MYIIRLISVFLASTAVVFADTLPKDWQLSFQEPATDLMADVMNFHSYILMPIITAISLLVLDSKTFLLILSISGYNAL